MRERVGMYDLTALTNIEVAGPGALNFLQYVAANQIDQPVGRIVYTSLLNQNGGIMRSDDYPAWPRPLLGPDRRRQRHARSGLAAPARPRRWLGEITDISSTYCNIGLWGPKARDVLQTVCHEDVRTRPSPILPASR